VSAMAEATGSEEAATESRPAGRPRLADDVRRSLISLRVPAWLAIWLKNQPISSGVLIEEALCTVHGLKRPTAERKDERGSAEEG
jgi:hypothetical protein